MASEDKNMQAQEAGKVEKSPREVRMEALEKLFTQQLNEHTENKFYSLTSSNPNMTIGDAMLNKIQMTAITRAISSGFEFALTEKTLVDNSLLAIAARNIPGYVDSTKQSKDLKLDLYEIAITKQCETLLKSRNITNSASDNYQSVVRSSFDQLEAALNENNASPAERNQRLTEFATKFNHAELLATLKAEAEEIAAKNPAVEAKKEPTPIEMVAYSRTPGPLNDLDKMHVSQFVDDWLKSAPADTMFDYQNKLNKSSKEGNIGLKFSSANANEELELLSKSPLGQALKESKLYQDITNNGQDTKNHDAVMLYVYDRALNSALVARENEVKTVYEENIFKMQNFVDSINMEHQVDLQDTRDPVMLFKEASQFHSGSYFDKFCEENKIAKGSYLEQKLKADFLQMVATKAYEFGYKDNGLSDIVGKKSISEEIQKIMNNRLNEISATDKAKERVSNIYKDSAEDIRAGVSASRFNTVKKIYPGSAYDIGELMKKVESYAKTVGESNKLIIDGKANPNYFQPFIDDTEAQHKFFDGRKLSIASDVTSIFDPKNKASLITESPLVAIYIIDTILNSVEPHKDNIRFENYEPMLKLAKYRDQALENLQNKYLNDYTAQYKKDNKGKIPILTSEDRKDIIAKGLKAELNGKYSPTILLSDRDRIKFENSVKQDILVDTKESKKLFTASAEQKMKDELVVRTELLAHMAKNNLQPRSQFMKILIGEPKSVKLLDGLIGKLDPQKMTLPQMLKEIRETYNQLPEGGVKEQLKDIYDQPVKFMQSKGYETHFAATKTEIAATEMRELASDKKVKNKKPLEAVAPSPVREEKDKRFSMPLPTVERTNVKSRPLSAPPATTTHRRPLSMGDLSTKRHADGGAIEHSSSSILMNKLNDGKPASAAVSAKAREDKFFEDVEKLLPNQRKLNESEKKLITMAFSKTLLDEALPTSLDKLREMKKDFDKIVSEAPLHFEAKEQNQLVAYSNSLINAIGALEEKAKKTSEVTNSNSTTEAAKSTSASEPEKHSSQEEGKEADRSRSNSM